MTIFNVSYCTSGTRVINYDYYYNHVFFGYSKREIEKKITKKILLELNKVVDK